MSLMGLGWTLDLLIIAVLLVIGIFTFAMSRNISWDDQYIKAALLSEKDQSEGFSLYPRQTIQQAGLNPDGMLQVLYWSSKLVLAALLYIGLLELGFKFLPFVMLIAICVAGFLIPDMMLIIQKRHRKRRVEHTLSYFTHLLVSFLLSGMTLQSAIKQSARFGLPSTNPLGQEMQRVSLEMEAGQDRAAALKSVYKRTGVLEVKNLMTVLQVGLEAGSPVVTTLQAHAEVLRDRESERNKRELNQKTLYSLFPIFLVGFPMMAVVAFFPPVIQLIKGFKLVSFLF
jgi:tight adherence protein C